MAWLDAVLQGVLLGGWYALFAMGLSLAYGVMRIVNIGHGDFIVLAAYVALFLVQRLNAHPLLVLPLVILMMAGLGYALQRGILNRTLGVGLLPPLLVTFGLSIVIQNALLQGFSADSQSLQVGGLATASIALGGELAVGWLPLLIFGTAVLVTLVLEWLFARTRLGMVFRATADDPQTARLVGIKDRHVYALAMASSFAVIALAGVFVGIKTTFTPDIGPSLLLYAFEAVAIGGLGSFWGTLAGSIVLGIAHTIGYQLNPGWGVLTGHLCFLVVVLFKPAGLFGRAAQ
jgi:branched-chain amino acid transport system permease protein